MKRSHNNCSQPCKIKCSPCVFKGRTVDAFNWCKTCLEGLCKDCILIHTTTKTLKKHSIISVEEYLSNISMKLDIQTVCKEHGKKLEFFCPFHDATACTPCLSGKHHRCENLVLIEEIAKHYRDSPQLSDLEKSLHETKRNIEDILRFNLQNKKSLVNCKSSIEKDITTIRAEINEYLDKLETKLLQELEAKYKECISEINSSMIKLEKDVQSINSLIATTNEVKNVASDTQCFLGTRDLVLKFQPIENRMDKDMAEMSGYEIRILLDESLSSFTNQLNSLGKINVQKSPVPIQLQNFKHRQAQTPLHVNKAQKSDEILILKENIPVLPAETNQLVTGCLILSNDKFVFIHRNKHNIFIQNKAGNVISSINISGSPFDAAVIDDQNVVVSYGALAYIEFINLTNGDTIRRVPVGGYCSGVCFLPESGNVYVIVRNKGIFVTSKDGKIRCLVRKFDLDTGYISVSTNKLVYTDTKNKSVYCLDISGKEIWNFRFDATKSLRGVQIDNRENVLLTDSESSQLILLSPDGGSSRIILDKRSDIKQPFGIYFDKCRKELLICNSTDGHAFVYKIE